MSAIAQAIQGRPRDIGGLQVRRILPYGGGRMVGPFIFLDHMGPVQFAAGMGLDVKTMASGGGCDANVFNRKGIECANLGTGMRAIHTVKEWLDVKDMYAAAEMTLEIMKLNGELAMK